MRRISPAIALFFLSPAIAELLSGSAPPAEFFHPIGFVVLLALYGSGAVLVRELALHWGKRWPTIIVLGLAYGILEEGLMVKSFFDPNWMDLGVLGVYGRWAGVNWIWSLLLMIYHSLVSIAIPIFLVELMYPDRRDEQWLGRRGVVGLTMLLAADVLFGFFALTPYRPPAGPYLLAIAATTGLVIAAREMPTVWFTTRSGSPRRPRTFGLLGFGVIAVFYFVLLYGLPALDAPVFFTIGATVVWGTLLFFALQRWSGDGAWSDEHKLALVSGALLFFTLLAPLQELDATRSDNTAGMTLVGLVVIAFLLWLRAQVRQRQSVDEAAQPVA